jgi:50S ribosomal protein L16 3-hydroxylase
MIIEHFDKLSFLKDYWQKRPCIIKGFINNFIDPIDEHELAGLAQEPEIDSRIIAKHANEWSVTNGPIDDFETACVGAWTLLVQGVDKQIPEVNELTKLVNFIPNWRMDDVMVSFSVEHAGVGPHIDEYDVFIVQGKGQRRWQVGLPKDYETHIPHPKIRQIKTFEAIVDEILEPGDAVYIPPNHPHNGVALTPCINYSLGFRAMTNYELLNGLFDTDSFKSNAVKRYADSEQSILDWASHINTDETVMPNNVSQIELQSLKANLMALIESDTIDNVLLQTLSHQHLCREVLSEEQLYSFEEVEALFERGEKIYPLLGLRPLCHDSDEKKSFCFFADGEVLCVDSALRKLAKMLINADEYTCDITALAHLEPSIVSEWITLIQRLLNLGLWIYESD